MSEQTTSAKSLDPSGALGPTEHSPPLKELRSRQMITSGVWGGVPMPVTAENGQDATPWNPSCSMYQYGTHYCLNGCQHPGMDIGIPSGTALFAAEGGQVVFSGADGFYAPFHVNLLTANGEVHIYGHMSSIDPGVVVGGHAQAGQLLGASGHQNGDHLHFERRVPNATCTSGFSSDDPTSTLVDGGGPPQPAFAARDRIKVNDPPLRLRDAPGLGAAILTELPLNTELCVLDGPDRVDGHDWYLVTRPEGEDGGWVAGGFCELVSAQGCP